MRGIHRESKQEAYDIVVIGAGIGGLSVAALLAKAGKSVLLIERHDRPGGYAHGFRRRDFHFDAGVHLVSGCGEHGYRNGSTIHKICRAVGIDPDTIFVPIQSYARVVYPDFEVRLRAGEDAFVSGLTDLFPTERQRLLELVRLCRVVAEEAMLAEEILDQGRNSSVSPARALANLFRYRRATLAQVLDEFLVDPRLKSACAALWPYLGLPPSQLSFLYWASMMAGYIYEGGYYCRHSFQTYADQLAAAITRHGGEVLLNSSVRGIDVAHGKINGVVLENGQFIQADTVVSGADLRLTAERLIGREHLPDGHLENLRQLQPSLSIFADYIGTDLALDDKIHCHESFFYGDIDHDLAYHTAKAGDPNWFSATIPTLTDPSIAPPGHHIMLLTTLSPFDVGLSWREAKPQFQQRLLEQAERQFPGFNDHLIVVESGSPRTLERYTLNHQGAAYGFSPTPDQIGPNRPGVRGAVPGLFHCGHWTRPGGGVAGVSISAQLAAQAILGIPRQEDFWTF